MVLVNERLAIFVSTSLQDVPALCARYLSVDGSVPGATVTWDHHVTGELINLDAMPDRIDISSVDGVGTTLADTDAVASVVAVLLGGKANIPTPAIAVLRAASHRCDHLLPHPAVTAEEDRLGQGFHAHVSIQFDQVSTRQISGVFTAVCREVAHAIVRGEQFPEAAPAEQRFSPVVEELVRQGRIVDLGGVGMIDLRGRGPIPVEALYPGRSFPVAVIVADHPEGGPRYTVGINPFVPGAPGDLAPALRALARAEAALGLPARSEEPGPGSENWGGRATVFGSPWNYGSRLEPAEVAVLVRRALGMSD